MQTRSWDGQDGQKKYRTEIVADRVQFGNRSNAPAQSSPVGSKSQPASEDSSAKDIPPVDTIEYPEEEINPDDIPF